MYYAEGTHEAIIDEETYHLAQERLKQISESTAGRTPQKHSVFTSKIRCARCGANFVRAFNGKPVWQCMTYRKSGRDVCNAKQIPEEILKSLCCEVLGINEFDEIVFKRRIESISADNDSESNILVFTLTNGETSVKRWQNPSRSKSWTPEMKAEARAKTMQRRSRKCL